jgi:hypothetical protein
MATSTSLSTSGIMQLTLAAGILVGIVCVRQSFFYEINTNAMQKQKSGCFKILCNTLT